MKPGYEERYRFGFRNSCYADRLDCAPVDDDTNYTCLYQQLVEKYGRDFTSDDVCSIWLSRQPITAYCTAERVAYRNMVMGLRPPYTATYENPYREWIGAQIRADYFGYINPGDPETAAEMAWRDARVSHVKNGIYGEMFVSAMIAEAAVTDDLLSIIEAGISEIPEKSRLYREVSELMRMYRAGKTEE
ncbi:MAG: ADP-ribosylglycohydrolase family protein [Clostridia bacterium]|nr:ADP-ribosylglycohydrolase family protein [Clostridia bacterium]